VQSHVMLHVTTLSSRMTTQDVIGEKLRSYYNALVEEPMPERIAVLLRRIEAQQHRLKPD
jgi:Anti-sigma factor NepR